MVKKQKNTTLKTSLIVKHESDSDDGQNQDEQPIQSEIQKKTSKKAQKVEDNSDDESYISEAEMNDDSDINDNSGAASGSEQSDSASGQGGAMMYSDEEGVSVYDENVAKNNEPKEVKEERMKQRRIEKLEKRIKLLQKKEKKTGPKKSQKFERKTTDIKNKHKRQEVVLRRRMESRVVKKIQSLQDKKTREEHGEEAAPKGKTKTIEMMRVADETLVEDPNDSDIAGEAKIDEFDSYFNRETTPRILCTTNRRPQGELFEFLKELKLTFPAFEYWPRRNFRIKDIIKQANEEGFTDIMVFQEKWGNPHSLILSHLPNGPTATFRVSNIVLNEQIPNHGANNGLMVAPELIMNNFDTMLGSRIGRMIASLFPQDPQLEKRRVVTWHNQRDFIFFRHHRYQFNPDGTRANLQEVGPRFTLKLHKLQLGTLDSKFGEYEFLYKPKDGVDRKQFSL